MKKVLMFLSLGGLVIMMAVAAKLSSQNALAGDSEELESVGQKQYVEPYGAFSLHVFVDGESVTQFEANGRRYIEALENAEYEVRIYNQLGVRVAVALSVDGLNTIDARHTSAWEAHKWVIEPYGNITVKGWQMNSNNARRFYFTTERNSYGAKIGQTDNLGVISAVFFRERKPISVTPVVPGRREDGQRKEQSRGRDDRTSAPTESSESAGSADRGGAAKNLPAYPQPDDDYAATGIGRNVSNDVTWIKMNLESQPAGWATIRYEYRDALVRLGIVPRNYPPRRRDVLGRRERAEGFEPPKYCPQP